MYGTAFSPDGAYRISAVNEDGSVVMRLYEHGKQVALPDLHGGQMSGTVFSGSGKLMAFYLNGDRSPSNLYVYDLRTKQARPLTRSLPKAIDPANLVDAEVVRFQSFDGMQIPSLLYKPKGASGASKVPALVYVHGGPGGQSKRGYDPTIQYLVNHGYAVLAINNRGSSGYGKSFQSADDRKHGREPLWDCVEAKTWLASLGYIDPQKIGIMGYSYGGYMTLAALAFRQEAFKVGVDLWGPSNWVRTLESIPPQMEAVRKALYAEVGDPATEKEQLAAVSPLFHAGQIRKPLMVIQGENDARVPKAESEEIVAAVRKNNVPVEYLEFAGEGHGTFRKKQNYAEASEKVLAFLDQYLKK
jgi:dipeptidyl aminopeptidase/acylaminoacyl peptidase